MRKNPESELTPQERREEILRPNPLIGYDHDSLALFLLSREMFTAAEAELRRSIYLNPFEPLFKQHLSWCLYKQGKYTEALELIRAFLEEKPEDKDGTHILSKILEKQQKKE